MSRQRAGPPYWLRSEDVGSETLAKLLDHEQLGERLSELGLCSSVAVVQALSRGPVAFAHTLLPEYSVELRNRVAAELVVTLVTLASWRETQPFTLMQCIFRDALPTATWRRLRRDGRSYVEELLTGATATKLCDWAMRVSPRLEQQLRKFYEHITANNSLRVLNESLKGL